MREGGIIDIDLPYIGILHTIPAIFIHHLRPSFFHVSNKDSSWGKEI
jgi:hypothetical protein